MEQSIINWLFAAVGALGGFIIRALWEAVQGLKKDHTEFQATVAKDYVRAEYFKGHEDREEAKDLRIFTMLDKIYDKLDAKADKV